MEPHDYNEEPIIAYNEDYINDNQTYQNDNENEFNSYDKRMYPTQETANEQQSNNLYPIHEGSEEYDGMMEDITPQSKKIPSPTKEKPMTTLFNIRLMNSKLCSQEPQQLPNQQPQLSKAQKLDEATIQAMQSAGKLANILELNDPEWGEVDEAIQQHIKVLKQKQQLEEENPTNYDPQMFEKTWVNGGYLPINYVRKLEVKDNVPSLEQSCLVIKTKIANKYNNTALIDEGANRSVLNIDWYEAQGIDWRDAFNVPQETIRAKVFMANEIEVNNYGTTTLNVEVKGTKKVNFLQEFQLLRLGASNYAQILGFDWKYECKTATLLPEYIIKLRKYNCDIDAMPIPIRLYKI